MRRPLLSALAVLLLVAARADAQEALESVRTAVEAARRDHDAGRTEEAIAALRAIVAEHPDDVQPGPLLAFLLLTETEDLTAAYEAAEEHLVLVPEDDYVIGLLVSIGDRALDRGDPELARHCTLAVMRERPGDKELHYRWALASYRMGEIEQARGAARQLISDWSSFAPAYWLLAMSLVDEGRFAEAVDVYRDLLRERSGDIQARMRMAGVLLWNLRDYDAAEKAFRDALAIADPNDPMHAEAQRGIDMVRAERDRSGELRGRYASLGTGILIALLAWACVLGVLFFLTRNEPPRS